MVSLDVNEDVFNNIPLPSGGTLGARTRIFPVAYGALIGLIPR